MKFGDRLQGNIEDVDDKGRGRYNVERPGSPEKSVVIPFAFPARSRPVPAKRKMWPGRRCVAAMRSAPVCLSGFHDRCRRRS